MTMTTLFAVLLLAMLAPMPAAGDEPDEPLASLHERVTDLGGRLGALTPEDPEAYFLLGEEVAYQAETDEGLGLARTLYVLAFELDRRAHGRSTLGASVCLGLADISRLERDRRWLRALARSLDARYAMPDWSGDSSASVPPETANDAAAALGFVRAGEGRRARTLLERPAVRAVIDRFSGMLPGTGMGNATQGLVREAELWPCPQCRNERIVTQHRDGRTDKTLCPTCGGNPGPRLSTGELIAQLSLESRLLDGIQRSWAAQLATDFGAPLRDPDPDELAPTFGVDPERPYWRAGGWTADPDAE